MKWTEKQKRGLRGSIRKWKRVVKEGVNGNGLCSSDCTLCKLYQRYQHKTDKKPTCRGCPIRVVTGKDLCHRSPYRIYAEYYEAYPELRQDLAKAELQFLQAILKAGS
jgi:hypothetical protein